MEPIQTKQTFWTRKSDGAQRIRNQGTLAKIKRLALLPSFFAVLAVAPALAQSTEDEVAELRDEVAELRALVAQMLREREEQDD